MLLTRIHRFLRKTGMSPSGFGRLAVGDPSFVNTLRHGRIPRPAMEARIEHFMNAYTESLHAN